MKRLILLLILFVALQTVNRSIRFRTQFYLLQNNYVRSGCSRTYCSHIQNDVVRFEDTRQFGPMGFLPTIQ
ncbi:hypothetical protein C8R43DRAFT_1044215 [Mycena crocata]|nr:hypothetical protein C8R43DRAFT_1044215 [Mycena crocata]